MKVVFLTLYAAGAFIYLDFALWYCAEAHNRWHEKKRRFRGIMCGLWDRLSK